MRPLVPTRGTSLVPALSVDWICSPILAAEYPTTTHITILTLI
ncbi:unnamed protein product [Tenebrio molitor]|nr:unnamed protein product [Tenebrio molitor]